jgi:prophage antirepressor-like protein
MADELSVFKNENFGELHSIKIGDEIWFVATDIARVLEYRSAADMVRILDDDEKLIRTVSVSGQGRKTNLINESGLYHAIIKSRKEEAKIFRKWVTATVLPAIRKTGTFTLPLTNEDLSREKSKAIRNCFTDMQKARGYSKRHEYIQTTVQMKKKLGITAKKDDMTPQERASVAAAEWLSIAMMVDEQGYYEVNPVCVGASETVFKAIENKKAEKLLA